MVDSKIISLAIFWCKTLYDGSLLLLYLILPLNTDDIPCQDIFPLEDEVVSLEEDTIEVDTPAVDSIEDITPMLGLEHPIRRLS